MKQTAPKAKHNALLAARAARGGSGAIKGGGVACVWEWRVVAGVLVAVVVVGAHTAGANQLTATLRHTLAP